MATLSFNSVILIASNSKVKDITLEYSQNLELLREVKRYQEALTTTCHMHYDHD